MTVHIAARRSISILQFAFVAVCVVGTSFSQASPEPSPLSLQQAATIALEKNPMRKAAMADTKAASAGVQEARSFLMPHIAFSEMGMRGNDPVYVFGSKLRQQRFTTNDFALYQLNRPTPIGDFTTRFGGTWNLFDSFASWHGINRAKEMNTAATHQLERTDQEILFRVVQSYYGVLLAKKQLEVSEQAEMTAKSIMDRSQVRYDAGLVVESDLLSAKVRLASREQELIRARNGLEMARAQLNTAMGVPADTQYQPADPLAERKFEVAGLPDVRAKGSLHTPGSEAHRSSAVGPGTERRHREIVIRPPPQRFCRMGTGQSHISRGRRRKQLGRRRRVAD